MKNKSLIILVIVFAALIVGAAVLYNSLSAGVETQNIQIQQTPTPESPSEENASEEAPAETESEAKAQSPTAPDFIVYDAEGNEVYLSDYFGKPIILNFWASWCGPCQMEMPYFQEKFEQYGEDVHFLMVNMTDGGRETMESASKFIEEGGFTFPVLFDTQSYAAYLYNVYSLPTTYGIDANGVPIVVANGAISGEDLEGIIDMIS